MADGSNAEVLLWVDDHSRFLISATAHARVTGPIVVAAFRNACSVHGTPQSTLTDNGFVFTTRHRGGPNGFEALLEERGMTQLELAARVGVTRAAMSRYCSGHREPRFVTLVRIAEELDVRVEDLIPSAGDPVQTALRIVARTPLTDEQKAQFRRVLDQGDIE